MQEIKAFLDTNILLYLLSKDSRKADITEHILQSGGLISVQVLNEMVNVLRRKLNMSWPEIDNLSELIRVVCRVKSVTIQDHDKGKTIAERYGFSIYDSMIVAAALNSGCDTLYSEDMHKGQLIDQQLQIINPFK